MRFQLTRKLSVLGGRANGARQKAKTHCPQGHPYAGENLYVGSKGERICLICKKASDKRTQERRRKKKFVAKMSSTIGF